MVAVQRLPKRAQTLNKISRVTYNCHYTSYSLSPSPFEGGKMSELDVESRSVAPERFEKWGDHQGMEARSNSFVTQPRIREAGQKSGGVNRDFLKSGAWAAPWFRRP